VDVTGPLTDLEVAALTECFPELSWMKPEDWQRVAAFADWQSWLDDWEWRSTEKYEGLLLRCLLGMRSERVAVRRDCRAYFGEVNVPNINDPGDPTWT
jgi:hypothetical protein